MARINNRPHFGTRFHEKWTLYDFYVGSSFFLLDGNDILQVHCDGSLIAAGSGNDVVILTGAWNHVFMGSGNDVVSYATNGRTIEHIGNYLDFGEGNDFALLSGNLNIVRAGLGEDKVIMNGDKNFIDLSGGNDNVFLNGDSSTIVGGGGSDNVSIVGNFNEYTVTTYDRDGLLFLTGAGNDIFCRLGGFKKIICSGDGNLIHSVQKSKIELSYEVGGASHQTTTIFGRDNTINWTVTALGSAQQAQKLLLLSGGVLDAERRNVVNMSAGEGSLASFVIRNCYCSIFLNEIFDSNKDRQFNTPFYINVEIASPYSTVVFDNNLSNIIMSQRPGNAWIYDFIGQNNSVYGTLQVTQALGKWGVSFD